MHLINLVKIIILFSTSFIFALSAISPHEVPSQKLIEYPLPDLEYGLDDLEPYIDGATVRAHYHGHHESYRKKMNGFLSEWRSSVTTSSKLPYQSLYHILQNLHKVPIDLQISIQNNVGGYVNHAIYWSILSPNPDKKLRSPKGKFHLKLIEQFESFDNFKSEFTAQSLKLFGSGYVWLVREQLNENSDKSRLRIVSSVNQDSPLTYKLLPLLVIDIWEHAYYLKHQYNRKDHIDDFWYLVDWEKVERLSEFWNNYDWLGEDSNKEEL